jgi:hypothetical protein
MMPRHSQMGGKSNLGKILKDVNKVARKTKILSSVLKAIPVPEVQAVGQVARSVGYGMRSESASIEGGRRRRRKRMKRKMRGRGQERLGDSVLGIGYQISHPVF